MKQAESEAKIANASARFRRSLKPSFNRNRYNTVSIGTGPEEKNGRGLQTKKNLAKMALVRLLMLGEKNMAVFLAYLAFILIKIGGGLLLELILMALSANDGALIMTLYQLGGMVISCLLAFPAYMLISKTPAGDVRAMLAPNKRPPSAVLLGVVLVLLALTAGPMILMRFLLPDFSAEPSGIISGVWLVLITPVIEEIMFRGVMLNKLKIRYGIVPAVLVTTVLFAIGHLNAGNMFISLLPGVVLAVTAIKTESILYTIPLHMLVNLCGTVVLPLVL